MVVKAYTVGYGGRKPAEFVALLQQHGVRTIVDVRLRPDRASMGSYILARDPARGIAGLLTSVGIRYASRPELGNLFLEYDDKLPRYSTLLKLAGSILFDRITDLQGPMCLMCAEKRVSECHRRDIAEYLAQTRGWDFEHIE